MKMTALAITGYEEGNGPQAMECWQFLEIGKGKRMGALSFKKECSPAYRNRF